jgi:hypothetical protein
MQRVADAEHGRVALLALANLRSAFREDTAGNTVMACLR